MDVSGRRHVRAELLAYLIDGKIRLSLNYSARDIMQDLELELGIRLTSMQLWRVREFLRIMVLGKPEDYCKLLSWMCAVTIRASPRSMAFCEVHELGFHKIFMEYGTNINRFKLGCRMILFVDGFHLNGPYKGTTLAACALDANNHFLNFTYAIVSSETVEDWVQFLQSVAECLGGLKPVIMFNQGQVLLKVIPLVFGKENHSYCLRHLGENFL